ncbi:MAG: hypothetical protein JWO38_1255 [Gemmataceae bacterium]|nr:hypothetical protein [Gemmataceae bacterium]
MNPRKKPPAEARIRRLYIAALAEYLKLTYPSPPRRAKP